MDRKPTRKVNVVLFGHKRKEKVYKDGTIKFDFEDLFANFYRALPLNKNLQFDTNKHVEGQLHRKLNLIRVENNYNFYQHEKHKSFSFNYLQKASSFLHLRQSINKKQLSMLNNDDNNNNNNNNSNNNSNRSSFNHNNNNNNKRKSFHIMSSLHMQSGDEYKRSKMLTSASSNLVTLRMSGSNNNGNKGCLLKNRVIKDKINKQKEEMRKYCYISKYNDNIMEYKKDICDSSGSNGVSNSCMDERDFKFYVPKKRGMVFCYGDRFHKYVKDSEYRENSKSEDLSLSNYVNRSLNKENEECKKRMIMLQERHNSSFSHSHRVIRRYKLSSMC